MGSFFYVKKPIISLVFCKTGSATEIALSFPVFKTESIYEISFISLFITLVIGSNFETDKSAQSLLKIENSFPEYSSMTVSTEVSFKEANMEIKFSASGLFSKSVLFSGSGSGSVFAFLIF